MYCDIRYNCDNSSVMYCDIRYNCDNSSVMYCAPRKVRNLSPSKFSIQGRINQRLKVVKYLG